MLVPKKAKSSSRSSPIFFWFSAFSSLCVQSFFVGTHYTLGPTQRSFLLCTGVYVHLSTFRCLNHTIFLYILLSYSWSFNHSFPSRLASWFKLGSQVGLTTYLTAAYPTHHDNWPRINFNASSFTLLDTTVPYSYPKVKQYCDLDGRLLGYSRHCWHGMKHGFSRVIHI